MRDGGPAFPIANAVFNADAPDSFEQFKAATSQSQGMSLRDWFAGMTLQGLISSPKQWWWKHEDGSKQVIVLNSEHCQSAYEMADAMLAEREKP